MARSNHTTLSDPNERPGAYRWYVLGLLTLIYAMNFVDRQIVVIVAPDLKLYMGISDAQVGLLYGTAFALFYALFGIPLAKLADGWSRVGTISISLSAWSVLTALSGLTVNFGQLLLARIGVGIGEASASPASASLLLDYFPKAKRATALAVYMSGINLGIGASLMIGGYVIGMWNQLYPVDSPFGLKGWQAAYLAVAVPGTVLAILLALTVREPIRGAIDGNPQPGTDAPFRKVISELGTLLPPFSVLFLRSSGAPMKAVVVNIGTIFACLCFAVMMIFVTDPLISSAKRSVVATPFDFPLTTNDVQWIAIAIGIYGTVSWIQSMRWRDAEAARLTVRSTSFVCLIVGAGLITFGMYGASTFLFIYGRAYLGLAPQEAWTLGAIAAIAGGMGTLLGGFLADLARRRHPAGGIVVAMLAVTLSSMFAILQYTTDSLPVFYIANFFNIFFITFWLGPISATLQDHVPPRIRGLAMAVQYLAANLIGLGLGPYLVGLVSDVTGDLRFALLTSLAPIPVVMVLFAIAIRSMVIAAREGFHLEDGPLSV